MHISTSADLISPVYSNELADFARLDSDDPLINICLNAATSAAFHFMKQDLVSRAWTLTYQDWPAVGTSYSPSIGRQGYKYKKRIELPYTNLISVDSVTVSGVAETEYTVIKGKPYCLEFESVSTVNDDSPALEVTYTAGFGANTSDVPQAVRSAILLAASYIYAHNGGCDYQDAINKSGAGQLLAPYAVNAGLSI